LPIIPEWFYHLFFVTPERFYQGSTVFKTKEKAKTWIPTSSSPRQSLSRGPWFLRISGFPTKDFRNDGEKGMLHQAKNPPDIKREGILQQFCGWQE